MPTLGERILSLIHVDPGLSDRQITYQLVGRGAAHQGVNQTCRALEVRGRIARRPRPDGKIGNYPADGSQALERATADEPVSDDPLSEDGVKRSLKTWLEAHGWDRVDVAWGKGRGTDVDARGKGRRWIIEAKGRGSLNPMRVNYFVAILGEILQRMNDPKAKYSIALPDLPQFRNLWARLPALAKSRTAISALFVDSGGGVAEEA